MPLVIGMIALGVILLGGIIWAVVATPSNPGVPNGNPNLSFNDANDPVIGPENAPVTIRAFEDLECPACRSAKVGVDYVLQTYGDNVRFIWNDFPLPATIHPNARIAANAARCAEEQGKFWEMVDELYDAQSSWSRSSNIRSDFEALGRRIELDIQGFRACLDERRHDRKITADLEEGRANGVNSTPTFFVNNVMYAGALSPAQWDDILKPLLAAHTASQQAPAAQEETSPATDEQGAMLDVQGDASLELQIAE